MIALSFTAGSFAPFFPPFLLSGGGSPSSAFFASRTFYCSCKSPISALRSFSESILKLKLTMSIIRSFICGCILTLSTIFYRLVLTLGSWPPCISSLVMSILCFVWMRCCLVNWKICFNVVMPKLRSSGWCSSSGYSVGVSSFLFYLRLDALDSELELLEPWSELE